MGGRDMKRVVCCIVAALAFNCTPAHDAMQKVSPDHIAHAFFDAWQRQDWKSLYAMAHPSFIETLKIQRKTAGEKVIDDETLFINEFKRVQGMNPNRVLHSYRIQSITPYHTGDTTVWVTALVNDKVRRIPLTLDGLSLKVDLLRIE